MVTIEFLGPIQKAPLSLEAASLHDVADALKNDTEMAQWLENCAVAVNDARLVQGLEQVRKQPCLFFTWRGSVNGSKVRRNRRVRSSNIKK